MRNFCYKISAIMFFVFFALYIPCHAKLQIKSDDPDKVVKLVDMLKTGIGQVGLGPHRVKVNIDQMGNVTMTGTPKNVFGKKLKMIIDDSVNVVCVTVSDRDGNAVMFIGGFNQGVPRKDRLKVPGNGQHTIDVGDLTMVPTTPHTGIITQQALLIHELAEAWDGIKNKHKFQKAHTAGLDVEDAVLKETYKNKKCTWTRVRGLSAGGTGVTGNYYSLKDENGKEKERRLKLWKMDRSWNIIEMKTRKVAQLRRKYFTNGCLEGKLCSFDKIDSPDSEVILNPVAGADEAGGFIADLIVNNDDNILASVPFEDKVVRITPDGTIDQVYSDENLLFPLCIAFNPETNELFVASGELNQIVIFDYDSGIFLGTVQSSCISEPAGLDLDHAGNIYVASYGSNSICHLTPDGELINSFTDENLEGPRGLRYAVTGELYVVSNTNNRILVFDTDGLFLRTFASGSELDSPFGIDLDGDGSINPVSLGSPGSLLTRIAVANLNSIVIYNYPDGNVEHILTDPAVADPTAVALGFEADLLPDNSVVVSIPDVTAAPGPPAQVLVNISGDTVNQIFAGSVKFTYDESVISSPDVSAGGLLDNFSFVSSTDTPGQVGFAFSGAMPLNGDGALAIVTFNAVGPSGSSTQLELTEVTFNEGAITAILADGILTVSESMFSVTGMVTYYNDSILVPGVELILSGSNLGNTTTDNDGSYSFNNLSGGNTILTPSKVGDQSNAITNGDALLNLKFTAFLEDLTDDQKKAADVNEDGVVNNSDALAILRFTAFFTTAIGNTGQWSFRPPSITFENLASDQTDQTFTAFLLGDADGSWALSTGVSTALASMNGSSTLSERDNLKLQEVSLSAGTARVEEGKEIRLPIRIELNGNEATVNSLNFTLEYDGERLEYKGMEINGLAKGWLGVDNGITEEGKVHVSMVGLEGIRESGEVAELVFETVGSLDNKAGVKLSYAKVNDVEISMLGGGSVTGPELPESFELMQNYPNPFNPSTTITFSVPDIEGRNDKGIYVNLTIYNVRGQLVKTLVDGKKEPGIYSIFWDGKHEHGEQVSSGIYFYSIQIQGLEKGAFKAVRKMLILK